VVSVLEHARGTRPKSEAMPARRSILIRRGSHEMRPPAIGVPLRSAGAGGGARSATAGLSASACL
jgi:hypothetical protein